MNPSIGQHEDPIVELCSQLSMDIFALDNDRNNRRPASDPLPFSFVSSTYQTQRPGTMKSFLYMDSRKSFTPKTSGSSSGVDMRRVYSDSVKSSLSDDNGDNSITLKSKSSSGSIASPVQRDTANNLGVDTSNRPLLSKKNSSSSLSLMYKVRFKRNTSTFKLADTCQPQVSISIGDYVKVEADRGYDIGVVCGVFPASSIPTSEAPTSDAEKKVILDVASPEEKVFLLSKMRDEARALQICKDMSAARDMQVQLLDAEFQFDRNKLTFVFTSNKRTDFRELVKDLFSFFKTRIWMQKINANHVASFQQSLYTFPGLQSEVQEYLSQPKSNVNQISNESSNDMQRRHVSNKSKRPPEHAPPPSHSSSLYHGTHAGSVNHFRVNDEFNVSQVNAAAPYMSDVHHLDVDRMSMLENRGLQTRSYRSGSYEGNQGSDYTPYSYTPGYGYGGGRNPHHYDYSTPHQDYPLQFNRMEQPPNQYGLMHQPYAPRYADTPQAAYPLPAPASYQNKINSNNKTSMLNASSESFIASSAHRNNPRAKNAMNTNSSYDRGPRSGGANYNL